MIHIPNILLFVENPKTASTSIRRTLLKHPLAESVHKRHAYNCGAIPNCYCFTVVRNPYERLVSGYFYSRLNNERHDTFYKWLVDPTPTRMNGPDFKRTPQVLWTFKCNEVVRYEELDKGWEAICSRLNLEHEELPRVNVARRKIHYRDTVDEQSKRIIEDRFAPDFEQWGWKW